MVRRSRDGHEDMPHQRRSGSACLSLLRTLLKLTNVVLLVIGLTMISYAFWMDYEFKHTTFHPDDSRDQASGAPAAASTALLQPGALGPRQQLAPGPAPSRANRPDDADGEHLGSPWFIYTFGGAGLFVVVTAGTGLIGTIWGNHCCLATYAFMIILMLLAQLALAVAYFADDSWKSHIPLHDDTGEAERIAKFITARLAVVKWVGVGALAVQLLSIILAWLLSSYQMQVVSEEASEDDDEVWGRRQPLLPVAPQYSRTISGGSTGSGDRERLPLTGAPSARRSDPWSLRMKEKYGLDTSAFSYDPERRDAAPPPAEPPEESRGSRCVIM